MLSSPLKESDELTIKQEVDRKCERPAKTSDPVTVGKTEPVDAPTVLGPLWPFLLVAGGLFSLRWFRLLP